MRAREFRLHSTHQKGLIVIFATLAMTVFMLITALVVDGGFAYYKKRQLQTVADAGALNAAYALLAGKSETDVGDKAIQAALSHNFDSNNDPNVTISTYTYLSPSTPADNITTGFYQNDPSAVQVKVDYTIDTFFLNIIGMDNLAYSAKATALAGGDPDPNCIYVLSNESKQKMLYVSSSPSKLEASCGLIANLNGNDSLYMESGTTLQASRISTYLGNHTSEMKGTVKQVDASGHATCTGNHCVEKLPNKVKDPLKHLDQPEWTGCDHNGLYQQDTENGTIQPGVYCGGLKIAKNTTMESGVYVVKGKEGFSVSGSTVKGDGVTVFVTHNNASEWKPINIGSGSTLNMTPCDKNCENPIGNKVDSNGDVEGILFWTDRTEGGTSSPEQDPKVEFSSGSTANLKGVIYTPNHHLIFSSQSKTEHVNKSVFVSRYLTLSSGSTVKLESPDPDLNPLPFDSRITLVE